VSARKSSAGVRSTSSIPIGDAPEPCRPTRQSWRSSHRSSQQRDLLGVHVAAPGGWLHVGAASPHGYRLTSGPRAGASHLPREGNRAPSHAQYTAAWSGATHVSGRSLLSTSSFVERFRRYTPNMQRPTFGSGHAPASTHCRYLPTVIGAFETPNPSTATCVRR